MDFFSNLLRITKAIETSMKIAASHPALAGHFPGSPVAPGVLLLDVVATALSRHVGCATRVTGFPSVKFLSPLLPEREFEVSFTAKRPGQLAFVIAAGDEKLTSGSVDYIESRPAAEGGGSAGPGFRP